jgi:hypothetical protein
MSNGDKPRLRTLHEYTRLKTSHFAVCAVLATALVWTYLPLPRIPPPPNAGELTAKCTAIRIPAGPPLDFPSRPTSDRFVQGTRATLVTDATIWTGGDEGTEVLRGDVLLDGGVIRAVGHVPEPLLRELEYDTLDAGGRWVTPGLSASQLSMCCIRARF